MPTIITHAAIPIALSVALTSTRIPHRLLLLGIIAAMLPDLDVLAFKFGIAYAHDMGHRGITHSLTFAAVFASLCTLIAHKLHTRKKTVFAVVFICTASHGFLDMLTNGGLGIAYFWPFSHERYFLPAQFIQVSPIGKRFFSEAGLKVLESEILTVWLPVMLLSLMVRMKLRK